MASCRSGDGRDGSSIGDCGAMAAVEDDADGGGDDNDDDADGGGGDDDDDDDDDEGGGDTPAAGGIGWEGGLDGSVCTVLPSGYTGDFGRARMGDGVGVVV